VHLHLGLILVSPRGSGGRSSRDQGFAGGWEEEKGQNDRQNEMTQIYSELKQRFQELCRQEKLLDEKVDVHALVLTTEEAIGHPEDQDFPLQKGKERL